MNSNNFELYKPWKDLKGKQILSVNCGSSSIKVSVFEYDEKEIYHRLIDASLKGINTNKSVIEIASSKGKEIFPSSVSLNINEALKLIFSILTDKFNFSFASLIGIGHRFVHGGDKYFSSLLIDLKIISELEKLCELAPLHNDACLSGIKACYHLDDSVPQVAVFDTAFYRSLPDVAVNYAISNEMSSRYPIKRYGFHGISHAFLWETYKESRKEDCANSKIITLHLGSGCSITAISGGKAMDTSMGFTPAEGLIMATRAGDIDAAIIEFICLHDHKTPSEVMEKLNFHSGLLGISGISSSLETLVSLYHREEKAKLAVDMFCYRIVKYIGAYLTVLGGAQAIIFSGGIGENSPIIRDQIIHQMNWYGIKLDKKANQQVIQLPPGAMKKISASDSAVSIFVIGADENFFIAKEVECKIFAKSAKNPRD